MQVVVHLVVHSWIRQNLIKSSLIISSFQIQWPLASKSCHILDFTLNLLQSLIFNLHVFNHRNNGDKNNNDDDNLFLNWWHCQEVMEYIILPAHKVDKTPFGYPDDDKNLMFFHFSKFQLTKTSFEKMVPKIFLPRPSSSIAIIKIS